MENRPSSPINPNPNANKSGVKVSAYMTPERQPTRREQYNSVWEAAHRRGRRSRVGRFLYLTFAEMGVRASAELATRSEPSFLARQFLMQRMIANWRATRRRLEEDGY